MSTTNLIYNILWSAGENKSNPFFNSSTYINDESQTKNIFLKLIASFILTTIVTLYARILSRISETTYKMLTFRKN